MLKNLFFQKKKKSKSYCKSSPHTLNGVMILFIQNRRGTKLIFLLIFMVAIILCGVLHKTEEEQFQKVASVPISNKVIVLDAGHGGFDAGATANGVVEKDVNLQVALCLKEYFEQGGAVVLLTRNEDESTAEEGKSGISAKKSDLLARKQLADSSEADVFISIHMNQFPQSKYHGAQVFYSDSQEEGKKLGEEIQQGLKDVLQDQNTRVAKKIDGGVFLLKNTTIPSVIVECGFLSNSQEANLLQNANYQQKLAWGIYIGVVRYFNQLT